jgi:hypothetical protein
MNERNGIYTSAVGQCLLRDLDKGWPSALETFDDLAERDARAQEIAAVLRTEQLTAPAAVGIIIDHRPRNRTGDTFCGTPERRHLPLPARTWCHPRRLSAR